MWGSGRIKGSSQACNQNVRKEHSEEACVRPRLKHEPGLRRLPGSSLWRLGLWDPVKGAEQ